MEREYQEILPGQEKAVFRAVENTCELCSDYYPSDSLEVHRIDGAPALQESDDPSLCILVVCRQCHHHIHSLPVPESDQRAIVSHRSFYRRRDLRKALGYRDKPYIAPDDTDLSTIRPG